MVATKTRQQRLARKSIRLGCIDDRLLGAWFGNMARVLAPGRGFYIWRPYANRANCPPMLKATSLYFSQPIISIEEHPFVTQKDRRATRLERVWFAWERGKVREP